MSTFLDTNTEIHAATHGIYAGMTEWKGMELPNNPDIQKEPHYFKGGYIAGTILRWLLVVLAVRGI